MHEKTSISAVTTLKKLKNLLKINTDIQLSEFLNVKPNTISTWKKRNSLDFTAIISICQLYEIDLNQIFIDQSTKTKLYDRGLFTETPLVSRELQFEYCLSLGSMIDSLPKYNFPFSTELQSCAFQVISNNMSPQINENSFVLCEITNGDQVADNSIVVIVSKVKGLFINKIARSSVADTFILSSTNPFYNDVRISNSEINEIWLIKAVMCYNINNVELTATPSENLNDVNLLFSKS